MGLAAACAVAAPGPAPTLRVIEVSVDRRVWPGTSGQIAALARSVHLEPVMRQGRLAGVKIYRIAAGSVADRLGLASGDEIVAVDGRRLGDLAAQPLPPAPERVEVRLRRGGRPVLLRIAFE